MAFEKQIEPLNLDRYLGRDIFSRIALVGVELEGGWVAANIPNGKRPQSDGSVFKEARKKDPYWLKTVGCDCSGEITSKPLLPIGMPKWVRKFYPTYVDKTCGLHIHMSFDNMAHYARLMTPEFPVTVLFYLKRWAEKEGIGVENPLWERMRDQSKYCQHKFWPDKQVELSAAEMKTTKYYDQDRVGSRYTVINYCYKLHGTMECRVLPMFSDVEVSIRALQLIMDVTNASLIALAKREEKEKCAVVSYSDEFNEYHEIELGIG